MSNSSIIDPAPTIELLIESGRYAQAEKAVHEALKNDPENLKLKVLLMRVYNMQSRVTELYSVIQEVLKEDPENFTAHIFLCRALSSMGKYKEAEKHIQIMRSEYPEEPYFPSSLASLYWFDFHKPVYMVEELLKETFMLDPHNQLGKIVEFSIAHFVGDRARMDAVIADAQMHHTGDSSTALLIAEHISHNYPSDYKTIKSLIVAFPEEKELVEFAIHAAANHHILVRPFMIFQPVVSWFKRAFHYSLATWLNNLGHWKYPMLLLIFLIVVPIGTALFILLLRPMAALIIGYVALGMLANFFRGFLIVRYRTKGLP